MKRPGFYISSTAKFNAKYGTSIPTPPTASSRVLYVSGDTTGNYWRDPINLGHERWNRLVWTCVPNQAELDREYDHVLSNPVEVPLPEEP